MKLAGKEDISITPQLIGQKGELIPKPIQPCLYENQKDELQ